MPCLAIMSVLATHLISKILLVSIPLAVMCYRLNISKVKINVRV
jgi:hypothetical protein